MTLITILRQVNSQGSKWLNITIWGLFSASFRSSMVLEDVLLYATVLIPQWDDEPNYKQIGSILADLICKHSYNVNYAPLQLCV